MSYVPFFNDHSNADLVLQTVYFMNVMLLFVRILSFICRFDVSTLQLWSFYYRRSKQRKAARSSYLDNGLYKK